MSDTEQSDTKEAREWLQAELGKTMPDWLAERVVNAVSALILANLADFAGMMADSETRIPERDGALDGRREAVENP